MSTESLDANRRRFLTLTTAVVGAVGAGFTAVPFISSWAPSAKAQAAGAPVEADISKLEPGQQVTFEWRGKPVWIIRRTKQQLADLDTHKGQLKDPDSTEEQQPKYATGSARAIHPEYLVLIGICTHLGCSPTFKPEKGSVVPDWLGGFLCPCHGSRFDLSGRVFSGVPAQLNLVVPPHKYINDKLILIGVDTETA